VQERGLTRGRVISAAVLAIAALVLASCAGGGGGSSPTASGTMILATTSSTRDSGLLDVLIPAFQRASECQVKTLAVGSGDALKLGERGDADVLLVHSPAAEEAYMRGGHGASRRAVMHNDFVLVGPPSDPAGIKGAPDAPTALRRIARARKQFISRGDDSGTNVKELALWRTAGIKPSGPWHVETGQGMGETLTVASQKQGYTLSDRGTFLATKNLDAKIFVQGGAALRNPYHVIVVRHKGTSLGCAKAFSSWITSAPTQRLISRFGVAKYHQPLFFPDAQH
jgi:tungstate transport system substrate-binding protein